MRMSMISLAAAMSVIPAVGALAQWAPGSELVGQSAQVETNGIVNTIYFDQGGAARIMTPDGMTIPATWSASPGELCLSTGAARECWPYAAPFAGGRPVTLTSNCQAVSTWTAMLAPPPPPPVPAPVQGERG